MKAESESDDVLSPGEVLLHGYPVYSNDGTFTFPGSVTIEADTQLAKSGVSLKPMKQGDDT